MGIGNGDKKHIIMNNKENNSAKSLYELALQGKHPDIRYPEKWKKHPNEPANRAINLYLRDIFTDLSYFFNEQVAKTEKRHLDELKEQTQILENVYTDSIFDEELAPFIDHKKELSEIAEAKEKLGQEGVWQEFLDNYNSLSSSEKMYFKELLAHTKHVATLKRYEMDRLVTGKYREYYWCPTKNFSLTTSHGVDTTLVPIGSYGRIVAQKMLYTTNILINLSDEFLEEHSQEIEKQYWDMVINETARGQEKEKAIHYLEENRCPYHFEHSVIKHRDYIMAEKEAIRVSVLDSVKEAIHSIQATISSCVAEKIDVFDSFDEHLESVISSRLPLQFAKILPFGYTLPVVRRGRYFVNMIEKPLSKQQKLSFSKYFQECASFFKDDYLKTRVYYSDERNPGLLGFGCPAAIKKKDYSKTGIEYILEAYMYVFKGIG